MPSPADREKALESALAQIDRQFGKGSVMRLGSDERAPVAVIPTGSIALDVALGVGGLPRGRIVEIYGPESSGKTTLTLHAIANAVSARVNTNPPCVIAKPFSMSSRTCIDTTASPGSARSTTIPSSADAASRTRWAVASATGPFPLNTRDAVDVDTPARRATSRSVGRRGVDRV